MITYHIDFRERKKDKKERKKRKHISSRGKNSWKTQPRDYSVYTLVTDLNSMPSAWVSTDI